MKNMSDYKISRYKDPGEGLKELHTDFNDWSSMLTTRSIEMAYAIIAANWAAHGNMGSILTNKFSKWSIIVVFIFLGYNLVVTRIMVNLFDNRYRFGAEDQERWDKEYKQAQTKLDPWPYTKEIENFGSQIRWIKFLAPLIAGLLFVISLF